MTSAARVSSLLLALTVLLVSLSPALARECGDDVAGARVPCSCGDVVTSDTRLRPDDPVVRQVCPYEGLIVAASPLADSITLDLNGLALRGERYGAGIRVESGGASGAVIRGAGSGRGYGEVVGFSIGIATPRHGAVARIEGVEVKGARGNGLSLRGRGVVLIDVTSSFNGGDGVRLSGAGGRLARVQAVGNGGNGLSLFAAGVVVDGAAVSNRKHGIVVRAGRATLEAVQARYNGGVGILAPQHLFGQGSAAGTESIVSGSNGRRDVRYTGRKEAVP
ncbi:MAG TPA: right-handed parallel beta-helix repeat-containing protein [Candidatus Binatia bacterium]|nr:right-handed parallel beta-helix repeat-containing protein [Candidatus Binatia bacterium]